MFIPLHDEKAKVAINAWLVEQLSTATEEGGNVISEDLGHVENADEVDGSVLVAMIDGRTFAIELSEV